MRGLGSSLAIVAAFVVVVWLIGSLMGFEISLLGALGASLILTLVLNLVLGAFGR